jgi:DNA ligase D-like protein (predicted ligase)
MNNILSRLSKEQKEKVSEEKFPRGFSPMLATLSHDYFSDDDWIFERKWDGERALAARQNNEVKLFSRNGKEITLKYPEIIDALKNQFSPDYLIDGEIVTFNGKTTSFSKLQQRMQLTDEKEISESKIKVFYYVFDIVHLDGYSLKKLSLRERKSILKKILIYEDSVRFTQHRNGEGEKYHHEACQKGWEGIIAKESSSEYVSSRSKKWLKFKCINQQEFVIGGFTDPEGERKGFGALLIGFYKKDKLWYAGKVGTGYDEKTLERLKHKMDRLTQQKNPFQQDKIEEKHVHFIRPKLVCEVGFTEWTNDDKLRHPRFLGLRDDKKPEYVRKEK